MNFLEIISFIRELYKKPTGNIYLHEPIFIGNEKRYINDAIDSTFVSSVGKYVDCFEAKMCQITGAKYAIACVNGTAALHMSLLLAGVQKNDLVLTQAVSFIATCNAITYIGAQPLFIDINKDTLGLCPKSLENYLAENATVENDVCIHKTTKQKISACVPMHTFGHPVQLNEIFEICNTYKINLVEDAAESIGSYYDGKHTGNIGLLAAFSFNGNKTVTCGGGGCIVTNDEKIARLGKHLTTQSKIPHKWEFTHDNIGYNYRLPNLNAAMACAQLEMLDVFVENKRKTAQRYLAFFENTDITCVAEPQKCSSNYWLNAIILQDKTAQQNFLQFSNDKGVMTRPIWTLMNKLAMFNNAMHSDLVNSTYIEERLVNLPSSVLL